MNHLTYQNSDKNKSYDVLIIGSGIGGLGLAAILAKHGKRVLVLERHYVPGGFTHTFARQGYEWDVGVHYVGEAHREGSLLRKTLDYVSGGELKWAAISDPYDRVIFPDKAYDFLSGKEAFVAGLIKDFPGEEKAIFGYIKLLYEVASSAKNYFAEKALPPLVSSLSYKLLCKKFFAHSDKTTLEVLSGLTANPKLQSVLAAQWGDYGLPPSQSSFAIHAMVAKHYLNGGAYPVGGSARFAETIIPVIAKAGGAVLVKADVQKIIVHGDKAVGVKLANGDEILAPIVVSDAGALNTFTKLLPNENAAKFKNNLDHIEASLSHICLYAGLKNTAGELGLKPGNLWIYPDYDYDRPINAYLKDPAAALPLAYVSFPSAKDPSWESRYPGRATIEVISFAPYEWFKKWEGEKWHRRGAEYDELKAKFSERLIETLYRHVPQVQGRLDYHELSTPLSTRHFCNYEKGEIYGLNHTPKRFRQKWLRPRTAVKNLYLTGQDIVSDGIAGALFGGVLTASVLLKKNIISHIVAGHTPQ